MIRALFLDLDGTLLENDIGTFLPAYLNLLGEFMAEVAPPEQLTRQVLQATQAMVANQDPRRTLKEVFDEAFYPAMGTTEAAWHDRIDRFYREVFPELRALCRPRPGAQALVAGALARGLEVVIATNPLFPRVAIEQRLAWAGVPVDRFRYSIVASYESFHFAKPNMAFFAEALGRLGLPPAQAAMVGDEETTDLVPARHLGMAARQVGQSEADLERTLDWLERQAAQEVDPEALRDPDVLLALIRGHTAALDAVARDLPEDRWRRRPAEAEWAPVEILCHLRDVEREVNQPRIEAILRQDTPFLSASDTDRWAETRDYLNQSGPQALAAYLEARLATLARLEGLHPDDWRRPARHALLGPTDLVEIVALSVEHERLHLAQLRQALASPQPTGT